MFNLKKGYIIVGIIFLLFFLVFPVIINYAVMSWPAKYVNGSEDAWLGFISSYYGSLFSGIIGGVFTYGAVYLGFYKNDKDKFLDTYDVKVFVLKENLELLGREFLNQLAILPNTSSKLKYYYERIDLLNEIYNNVKFVVGVQSARSIDVFVKSYSGLKYKVNSDGEVINEQNIEELCEHQMLIIQAIFRDLEKKLEKLNEKYNRYTKSSK